MPCTGIGHSPKLNMETQPAQSGDGGRYLFQCSYRFVILRGRNRILERRRLSADGRCRVLVAGSRLVMSGATVVHRIIAAVESCPVWQVGSIFAKPTNCCDSRVFRCSGARSSQADKKNRIQGFQSVATCVN